MFATSKEEIILAERASHLKSKICRKKPCIKVKAGVIVDVTEMESYVACKVIMGSGGNYKLTLLLTSI